MTRSPWWYDHIQESLPRDISISIKDREESDFLFIYLYDALNNFKEKAIIFKSRHNLKKLDALMVEAKRSLLLSAATKRGEQGQYPYWGTMI